MSKVLPKKKNVSSSSKKTSKASTPLSKPEGESYWASRKKEDTRLDWRNKGGGWIEEYVASKDHPHRQLILNALTKVSPFAGVLELGCNAGPNLLRIQEQYPETQLAGIDINADAIERAQELLPKAMLKVAPLAIIPFADQSFDVVISDAVLMYIDKKDIDSVAKEMDRVVRKAIILVEWYDQKEQIKDYHWARDYTGLFSLYGFELVAQTPLTDIDWPHPTWVKNGQVFVFLRRLETGETSYE